MDAIQEIPENASKNTVCLKIDNVSSDGSGIARTDQGVVFVAGALPGERVVAEVLKRKKDFSHARTVRVLEPSPQRVTPRCPVFGTCGGCQLQHASYALQLKLKADIVRDALRRIGGFDLTDLECTPSPQEWGYRNKASFPIRKIKGKPVAGFYQAGSHRLITFDDCPVNAGPLNRLFGILQRELPALPLDVYDERTHKGALRHLVLRSGLHTGQNLASVVVNGRLSSQAMKSLIGLRRSLKDATLTLNHNSRPGNVILGERTEPLAGSGRIEETLDDRLLTYDTTSFFQVNTDQAVQLYRHVRDLAEREKETTKNVLELYSGVGSLTCYLAAFPTVTAVEEWAHAVELMKENLERNRISNVRPIAASAEAAMRDLQENTYDLVVLDPPRSGCDRSVLDGILRIRPSRVIYVSCNPSTLARDAKILAEGGYRLSEARSFDMFPQTVHVETVALLQRDGQPSNKTDDGR